MTVYKVVRCIVPYGVSWRAVYRTLIHYFRSVTFGSLLALNPVVEAPSPPAARRRHSIAYVGEHRRVINDRPFDVLIPAATLTEVGLRQLLFSSSSFDFLSECALLFSSGKEGIGYMNMIHW